MSVFSLTKGSEAALGMLARQTGSETLLLTQPARELRASINIERLPAVDAAAGFKLEAELFLRDQRHSMTLQHDDGANAQHLADWVEAVANGTLDTAQAIPQRQPVLLPCCRCEGVAIAYSYLAPAPAQHDLHGVKCRHRDCQSLEGATTAAAAADAWNDIQREELAEVAEPATAQDQREAIHLAFEHKLRQVNLPAYGEHRGDWRTLTREETADVVLELLRTRPAQTEQQPIAWADPSDLHRLETGSLNCINVYREKKPCVYEPVFLRAAPVAQTEQQPVAWGAFHFGGRRSGKLYTHCETEEQIESYIADLHRSNDSITLRKGPLYAAPVAQTAPQPEQSGLVEALAEAAQSLETISNGAGKDEFMQDMADVRGYARSRAGIARAALAASPKA